MRKAVLLSFIAVLLSVTAAAFAAGVSVQIPKTNPTLFTGETSSVDVVIVNSRSNADTFTLTIFNPVPTQIGVSAEKFLIDVGPNEQETVRIDFTPDFLADPQTVEYSITVMSTSDNSVTDTKSIFATVQRKTPVFISELSLEKYALNPGEKVRIISQVYNADDFLSDKYFLKLTIRRGADIVQTFTETIESIGTKSSLRIAESFDLDNYAPPGGYVVEAELRDANNQLKYAKSLNFNVNTVTQLPTEYVSKQTSYNVVATTTTITIINRGNVDLPPFTLTESVPKMATVLFSPDVEPGEQSAGNRIVYSWSVPTLAPGAQYTIKYSFEIWRLWVAAAIVFGAVYAGYKFFATPGVHKGTSHRGEIRRGKEIVVLVEARNRAFHEIKDVEVIDVVPQLVRIVEQFDTLRPKITKVPGGMELRWRIDTMKAREDRVLTYRIKPVVDVVGNLTLPQATMVYADRRKIRRSSVSKEALVKAN
ncbi:MAG: hypothetical protein HYT70_01450 [Candidatus Aenigmarchaeota archaeon]|nr:hypothetical protein [Candidatus Aenigmarchaeota archaeon]